MSHPLRVALFVTAKCNHRCSFCATQSSRVCSCPDMTIELMREIRKIFPQARTATLGGGEPLMHEAAPAMLNGALDVFGEVDFATNGTLVQKYEDQVPWERFRYINVSCHGFDRDEYKRVTGVDMFDRMVAGATILRRLIGSKLVMSTVVGKSTIERMFSYAQLAKRVGVSSLVFKAVVRDHLAVPLADYMNEMLVLGDEEAEEGVEAQRQKVLRLDIPSVTFPTLTPINEKPTACGQIRKWVGIDGSGNVGLCCRGFLPSSALGNVASGPRVWDTGPMQALRDRVLSFGSQPQECMVCEANWNPML